MSIFKRGDTEERSGVPLQSFQQIWGAGYNWQSTGDPMTLIAFYSAIRLIADQGASLPLRAYRDTDGISQTAPSPKLLTKPSDYTDLYTWKFQALAALLGRGNCYGVKTYGAGAWPTGIEWLPNDYVDIEEQPGKPPVYRYKGAVMDSDLVVHIPAFTQPGTVIGLSPVSLFRDTIDTGIRAQQMAKDWNSGAGQPGGILRNTIKQLVDKDAANAKKAFRSSVRNGDLFVTGSDWEYTSLRANAADVAFLETIRASATQIAAIFGIPPHMIGGQSANPMTYSNVEQDALNFVTFALRPWLVRFEEAISANMPRPVYARFDVDSLLRTDAQTRALVDGQDVQNGIRTQNEVRATRDLPPLEGGDELLRPKKSQDAPLPPNDGNPTGAPAPMQGGTTP